MPVLCPPTVHWEEAATSAAAVMPHSSAATSPREGDRIIAGRGIADGDPTGARAVLEHRRFGGSHDQRTAATIIAHQGRDVSLGAQPLLPDN
ncbi:MAG: hypothetical protein JO217_02400 [Acidobacteriaceae bacterium]|nr:hypothetical protein [Acidobacteriaceae bacterium]